jgi:hypothetical protein
MQIEIRDPVKEHEGTKDSYVSYCVKTRVRFGVSGSFAPLDRILMATIAHNPMRRQTLPAFHLTQL